MLKLLRIHNFALVDSLELAFDQGLNVLTGETGAGKSIILDALDAALGGSVSTKSVRTGAKKALIEAVFTPEPSLQEWLTAHEIDLMEEGVVCSREITGRTSRSRINGILMSKQQLQHLRTKLVEITAQGQTVQLQDPATQRRWLDGFGGPQVLKLKGSVQSSYQAWHKIKTTLDEYQQNQQNRLQRLDILEFQAQELNSLKLGDPDEIASLERERDRLSHSVELQTQSLEAYQLLYQSEGDTPSISDLLADVEKLVQDMAELDPELESVVEMVSSALIQVEEAGKELYDYGEGLESDPGRLSKIERRITKLKQVCRKYGPTLAEVIAHTHKVNDELDSLKDDGSNLDSLTAQAKAARKELDTVCAKLTKLRKQAANRLEKSLVTELEPLGMSGVRFEVEIKPGSLSADGQDHVTYLFSPNPGEPLQPLADTASGGEMSRFLLGLKAVFSQVDPVSTMVFDEIDAGVSGKMAQAIARKLVTIGRDHQILCVTHQPLIAAMADHHVRVRKVVKQKRTMVQADPLSDTERRDELAQLTAGYSAQEAITFVDSLLVQAQQLRAAP